MVTRWLTEHYGTTKICRQVSPPTGKGQDFPCGRTGGGRRCLVTYRLGQASVYWSGASKSPSMDLNGQNAVLHALNYQQGGFGGGWVTQSTRAYKDPGAIGLLITILPESLTSQSTLCGAITQRAHVWQLEIGPKWNGLADLALSIRTSGPVAALENKTSGLGFAAYVSVDNITTIAGIVALPQRGAFTFAIDADHQLHVFQWGEALGLDPNVDKFYVYLVPIESANNDYNPILGTGTCWFFSNSCSPHQWNMSLGGCAPGLLRSSASSDFEWASEP